MPKSATTWFGAIAGAALSFVLFAPEHFQQWPWLISLAKFVATGGLVGLGIMAQDRGKKARS